MTYIHDFTGRSISEDVYISLPDTERMHYHPVREENIAADLIEIGLEAALSGIILGDPGSDSDSSNFDPFTDKSSDSAGFDSGFGGGDYSGGGAGGDF